MTVSRNRVGLIRNSEVSLRDRVNYEPSR